MNKILLQSLAVGLLSGSASFAHAEQTLSDVSTADATSHQDGKAWSGKDGCNGKDGCSGKDGCGSKKEKTPKGQMG